MRPHKRPAWLDAALLAIRHRDGEIPAAENRGREAPAGLTHVGPVRMPMTHLPTHWTPLHAEPVPVWGARALPAGPSIILPRQENP